MLRLVIEDGEGTTHVVPLIRDEITIGRQEGNTIRLTERNVSRRHARLVRAGTQASPTVLVEDLDSYNGIRLNGDRVAGKCTMRPADLLQIGDYSLALKTEEVTDADLGSLSAAAAADEPPPPPVDPRLPEEERGRFVVVSSNLAGNEYALDRREVIIGRTDADENDVVIAHRSISRHHAKIIHRDGTFTIIDLASSNGVKVNGEAFGTATLVNGDIIELGHVKLRFCAPGDDYVFTSADVDDVEVESGPSPWQLIFVALLLVGVGIVAFLIVDRVAHNRQAQQQQPTAGKTAEPTPPQPPPVAEKAPPPDVAPIVARGNAALDAERWDDARKTFDEALAEVPDHVGARKGRDRAMREAANQPLFEGLEKAVEDDRWSDALARLEEFPADSVYASRVQARRDEIEEGYADGELERGRLLIQAGELDNAERLQKQLAQRDFAEKQARTLADEIEEARKQPSSPTNPVEAPEKPDDGAKKPPTRPKTRRPPSTANASFDDLITRALRRMMKSDRDAAIVLLKQAAQKRPSSHLPHQRLCAIYKAKQQYKLALSSCKKWLEREPNASYRPAIQRNIEQLQELINR